MSKISEQKALEEYPKETYYDRDVCDYIDVNATRRDGYIKGYDQAMQDFLEKACEWLKSYRQETSDKTGYIAGIVNDETIEQFKNYMENEM